MKRLWVVGIILVILAGAVIYIIKDRTWKKAVSSVPLSPEKATLLLQKRVQEEWKKKYYQSRITLHERMLKSFPESLEIKRKLASAYFGAGRLTEADLLLREIIQTSAADAEVFYEAGAIAAGKGDLKLAEDHLERALKLDPHHEAAGSLLKEIKNPPPPSAGGVRETKVVSLLTTVV